MVVMAYSAAGLAQAKAEPLAPTAPLAESEPRAGLPNVLAKLREGKEVRVAYLGGSITAARGWRVLSLAWLKERFPEASLSEINAAISGTGAELGVSRLQKDVLAHKPDLIFVEFAVNGAGPGQRAIRTMEGIVRQARRVLPDVDICFVYTLSAGHVATLQAGKPPEVVKRMEAVADRYGIPSIHLGLEVARMAGRGELIFAGKRGAVPEGQVLFSEDGTHPLVETGHPLYLAAIARSWPGFEQASGAAGIRALPEPLDELNWQWARLIPAAELATSGAWRAVEASEAPAKAGGRELPSLMVAGNAGDSFTFEFTGTAFGLYCLKGPDAGNFTVTIDGGEPLSGSMFDRTCETDRWRPRAWFCPVDLPPGRHTVKVEVSAERPDKQAILAEAGKRIDKPEQLEATRLYIGYIAVAETAASSGAGR
jgi:hypothetical protein